MANSKIYLGNTNVGSLFQGADDISIYLGENKVYPLEEPLKYSATLSNGDTFTINCNDNPTLTSGETWQNTTRQTTTTAATVGNCVTTLGENVFRYFQNMISVDIPSTVTSFSSSSFEGCIKLETINIPSGITSIPSRCFIQCYQLNNIEIPSGVTSIGNSAFQGCYALTSINIPSGITSISTSAFNACSGLTSVNIPSGVTIIGQSAFNGCSGLTSITVNSTIPPTLDGDTPLQFNGSTCPIYVPCESMDAYKSASGWSTYASRITCIEPPFQGKWKATYSDSHVESAQCDSSSAITHNEINLTNLVSVEIGDCVTSIGDAAFGTCSSLTSCTIGNSVTSIGSSAFEQCDGLASIDIPNSVTSIGYDAFYGCDGLTSIEIPDSITSIGHSAFQYCSGLTSCTIGSGVTSIDVDVFHSCTSLTSITVNSITPPTLGSGAFDNTNNCPIYVPCESLNAYKSASGWSDYASRITCLNPPTTYTYTVNIQGLEGKDVCTINWDAGGQKDDIGNGTYTYTTTATTISVEIYGFDTSSYSVDYNSFILTSNNPSKTVTFTYQGGGGNLQYIPQGTDMTQYYNRPITRFKIGDSSLPSGYQQLNIAFGGQQGQIAQWTTYFTFSGNQVTSLPCDVSGSDTLTQWDCFDSNWAQTANNPFTDLWIEFA